MPHVFWHVLILWHQNCVLQPDFAESVPVRTVMTKRDKTQNEIEIGRQQFHGAIWSGYEDQDAWLCIVLPVIDECRYCGLRDPCEHVR